MSETADPNTTDPEGTVGKIAGDTGVSRSDDQPEDQVSQRAADDATLESRPKDRDSTESEEESDRGSAELVFGLLGIADQTIAVDVVCLSEVAHIDALQPALSPGSGMIGMIPIRGALVPVVDPFGSFAPPAPRPTIAAVLTSRGQTLGLAVEHVQGLRRFPSDAVQRLADDPGETLSAGTIFDQGNFIHVLDVDALMNNPGLPKTAANLRHSRRRGRSAARPYLTFSVGGVSFAVKAQAIFGTVPSQAIEDHTTAGGDLLGTITYWRRRVPVLATNRVFGLGAPMDRDRFETVVLRFPGDLLIGLAVDRICQVAAPSETQLKPLDIKLNASMAYLKATATIDDTEHFLIDETRLHAASDLQSIAALSEVEAPVSKTAQIESEDGGTIIPERERYLMFSAGADLAVRMRDVSGLRVPPKPEEITPPVFGGGGVTGLFRQDGTMVPLVDLSALLGTFADPDPSRARVLLTECAGLTVGFLVDRMDGIATSTWYAPQNDKSVEEFDLVELQAQGSTQIRNCLDIQGLADSIVAQSDRA